MKPIVLIPVFLITLLAGCKKEEYPETPKHFGVSIPVTSIEGMKDGKPFINYLGLKTDGC